MDTLDWEKLASAVKPRNDRVLFESNKHLFTKLAFDVFRLNTSPTESLWVLEKGDDGKEYLAAMYDNEETTQLEVKSNWDAVSDRDCKNVTLLYKNTPLCRLASTDFGFNSDDVHVFQRTLVTKLSSDKSFKDKFLNAQSADKREMIINQFPELA